MMPRDPLAEQWAAMIRFTRAHHRLTQGKFGVLLGVTGQTISDWERSKTFPSAEYRSALMRMFAQAEAAKITEENGAAV